MKNLIDALYVNNSGGKVLLDYALDELKRRSIDCFLLLDERCRSDYGHTHGNGDNAIFLNATLKKRKEFYLQHRNSFEKILCFANIPPPVKTSGTVYTYFHNVLLLEQPGSYPFKNKVLKRLKGAYIRSKQGNTDYFIVQSEYVKRLLLKHKLCAAAECIVMPFFNIKMPENGSAGNNKVGNTFLYISNGNPHKNHANLLKAWKILYEEGINPELNLTITGEYKKRIEEINKLKSRGINIVNHGFVDPTTLYQRCEFLIYPSIAESFGLGLIEGAFFNCKVIAADLPYAHAVVVATASFDPESPDAIAARVKYCMNKRDNALSKVLVKNEIDDLMKIFS